MAEYNSDRRARAKRQQKQKFKRAAAEIVRAKWPAERFVEEQEELEAEIAAMIAERGLTARTAAQSEDVGTVSADMLQKREKTHQSKYGQEESLISTLTDVPA